MFKLAKKWVSLRLLLMNFVGTLFEMGEFVCRLFLIIFVFTLLEQCLFATRFLSDDDDKVPPEMMEHGDFLLGFVPFFQILIGENWNTVGCL